MPIADMIQTILGIKSLKLQQQAQLLAEQQAGHTNELTRAELIKQFPGVIGKITDPTQREIALRGYATATGLDPQVLEAIGTAAPSTADTSDMVVSAVANGDAKTLGVDPAAAALLRHGLQQRLATGETMKEAGAGQDFLNMGDANRAQANLIASGLVESAPQAAATELGYADLRSKDRLGTLEVAQRAAEATMMAAAAGQKVDKEPSVDDMYKYLQQQIQASQTAPAMTGEGQLMRNTNINNLIRWLKARGFDPGIAEVPAGDALKVPTLLERMGGAGH